MQLVDMTIYESLANQINKNADNIFIKYGNESYSWEDMGRIVDSAARMLISFGVGRGDRVGIYAVNSASWIISFFAIQRIGAVSVLINSQYKQCELIDCIDISDLKYLLYNDIDKNLEHGIIIEKLKNNKRVEALVCIDMEKSYDEWLALTNDIRYRNVEIPRQPEAKDIACILFTSGTTNICKGVKLSHYSLINNARQMTHSMRWNSNDIMCVAVPLFHCFGITASILCTTVAGNSLVILRKFRSVNVCSAIQENKCTILSGVPSMFMAMIRNKEFSSYDLSSLRNGIIAGSPICKDEYLMICNKLKGFKLQPSYGLTETSPCVSIALYDDTIERKAETVGKVLENVEVKIINDDIDDECVPLETGEIYVKGYNVTQGYLSSDPVLCDAVRSDGWFKTGDIGYMDEDGYLHIYGRRKNLIIRGGENISPQEIENYIKKFVKDRDVFVYGMKMEVIQEEIIACIEGKQDDELEKSLKDFLKENISKYKIPGHFVFIESFPRNSTGKINENKLKSIVNGMLK